MYPGPVILYMGYGAWEKKESQTS